MSKPKFNTYVGTVGLDAYTIAVRDENNRLLPKQELKRIAAKLETMLNHESLLTHRENGNVHTASAR